MIVLLDNFDSFTYNLVDDCRRLGEEVVVYRNNVSVETVLAKLQSQSGAVLLISPGPGTPDQAGNLKALLAEALGRFPVLGVCLGHQALVELCGGSLKRSAPPRHGKAFRLAIQDHPLFQGMGSAPMVGRYHSLVADLVPDCLTVLATSEDQVMAVSHKQYPALGLQFHPESLLTQGGHQLLANALTLLRGAS
ncbi:aminodeoxychorismate/anthranilate synthase component II [Gallaecimonas kandeliae]|uniref:anthranilate synthase component II n=1 Tax=Gallaecimonas kandeliae TaxID=3029055 RepID=UPI0026487185|nr:aminodeoxychorismate/anthranilate synthase component II [Gallaecimonas kandeliae]WKE66931.1 aminodeoxychorismate/anthranilate synthase component II [Gallaecimonas kandeliae]